jgi:8-oxo-dGTP pyrophosphatase MutT (NUDIX family)
MSFAEQAAAIPFRRDHRGVSVCLITRMHSLSWGIPKGMIEAGQTPEDTALQEAHEEAGLRGRLLGGPLGTYRHRKWRGTLLVAVYLMEVEFEAERWEEEDLRHRRWVSLEEAARLLAAHPVAPVLNVAARRIGDL